MARETSRKSPLVYGVDPSRRRFVQSALALPLLGLASGAKFAWSQATGFDFYISPDGSDGNPGTLNQPWSISALTTKTSQIAGKRVGLLDGTYSVTPNHTDGWGGGGDRYVGINITAAGSAQSPTVIQAVNPRRAVLVPAGGSTVVALIGRAARHCHLKDLAFGAVTRQLQLQIWGNDTRVEGCDFAPTTDTSIGGDNRGNIYFDLANQTPVERPLIRNCRFRGVYNKAGPSYSNNANALMGFSVRDLVVEYCTVSDSYSLFRPKYDWYGYTIRFNHMYDVAEFFQHLAVPAAFAGRVSVHNNLVFAGSGGYLYESTQKAANADVYNNTVVISGGFQGNAFRWWRELNDPTTASRFYNNIVHLTSDPGSQFYFHNFGGLNGTRYTDLFESMDFNCYPSRGGGHFMVSEGDVYSPTTQWSSLSAWRSGSGFESRSIQANPLFVGNQIADPTHWKLGASSPCLNAGRVGGTEAGAVTDMGCWTDGVGQIGCNFGPVPRAPDFVVS